MPFKFRITRITRAVARERSLARWCTHERKLESCSLSVTRSRAKDARSLMQLYQHFVRMYVHRKPMHATLKGITSPRAHAIITSLAYIRGKHAWIALWHNYCALPRRRYCVTSWQYTLRRYVTPCVYSIRNYSALCFVRGCKGSRWRIKRDRAHGSRRPAPIASKVHRLVGRNEIRMSRNYGNR